MEEKRIPVSEKYSLSVKEAADYFSIGTKKMRNEIYQEQLSNIIPHVCWHTYCSNQAKAGMLFECTPGEKWCVTISLGKREKTA